MEGAGHIGRRAYDYDMEPETMNSTDRLRAAFRGVLTVEHVEQLIAYTGEGVATFWARFDIPPSTWYRWKAKGAIPRPQAAHVLAWWCLRWAEAQAAFAIATSGDPQVFTGWPPSLVFPDEA